MFGLRDLDAFEVRSVPRQIDQAPIPQSFSALVAMHQALVDVPERSALVYARIREPGADVLRFVIGGAPELPGARPSQLDERDWVLQFPPGVVGGRIPASELWRALGAFRNWVRCAGDADPLWAVQDAEAASLAGSFTDYTAQLAHPFAWVIVADAVPRSAVEAERNRLDRKSPSARARASSASGTLALERYEERIRELRRAAVRGAWQLHVLVGGVNRAQVSAAAAVLCAATEIHRLPYSLAPATAPDTLAATWSAIVESHDDHPTAPFVGGTELLSALIAVPMVELPGVRLADRNSFDITPEIADPDGVTMGTVLDGAYQGAGTLTVSLATLNRHAFVTGATGSGKSRTTRHLLEQISIRPTPIPWLVIEPAKAEYAQMAGRLTGRSTVVRIRPGELDAVPASLNPLEPAAGFPLQSHLDLVRALFLAAFQPDEPFPQILSQALVHTYREAGWNLVTGEPHPKWSPTHSRYDLRALAEPEYPHLDDLQSAARRVIDAIGYGAEVAANVRGFIDVRIGSLLIGTPGRFFRGGHPLDIATLLRTNTVIELEDVTDDRDKAFIMGSIIVRIVEQLRVAHRARDSNSLTHVIVIEEAHRLLKSLRDGPAAASVELFASMLAEIRAYGEGVVVVEQIPSKIIVDVVKNTALKIIHRLPAADDRTLVGATVNLSEPQSRQVVSFSPGLAAIAADGMDRAVLVRVDATGGGRESSAGVDTQPPLVGRRSELCRKQCGRPGVAPCTLRQINGAGLTADLPRVRLWTEAVVISHLCGLEVPVLHPDTLNDLRFEDGIITGCALAHAVERSVAARWPMLRAYFDPALFVLAVYAQLDHQVHVGDVLPVSDYPRWQAGPYRWIDIEYELEQLDERGMLPTVGELDRWRARGARLAGANVAEFRESLLAAARRQPSASLCGDVTASGLRTAAQDLAGGTDESSIAFALGSSCVGPLVSVARVMARAIDLGDAT